MPLTTEQELIRYLAKLFGSTPPSVVGIGDDAAAIAMADGKTWVVTTDALVEGVHFLKEEIPPEDLGYKAISVNVSDIAAMAAEPRYAFLSIALPKGCDSSWIVRLLDGIKSCCDEWHIAVLGGDTVGSKRDLFLNITLIGTANADQVRYRHTAKEGDRICVTGYLGDSAGGLKALENRCHRSDGIEYLIHRHFRPKAHVEYGRWLGALLGVHAMMDLSDGIASDLQRLIASSCKGAVVDLAAIPISPELAKVCEKYSWDPLQLALSGGEDYCLMFTVAEEAFEAMRRDFETAFAAPIFDIGTITEGKELIYYDRGKKVDITYASYNHF